MSLGGETKQNFQCEEGLTLMFALIFDKKDNTLSIKLCMKEGENKLFFFTLTKNLVVFVFSCNSRLLTKLSFFIACWNNFM